MNRTKRLTASVGLLLCSVLAVALTGCTTYVEHRPSRTVYVTPPVAPPVVVIHTESDFYEPLGPHGEWVVIGSYGRCWRPSRVYAGWRPYCDGHWRRTDAGWYWASDEPWGWATYHYGRWDWTPEYGWVWVPQTQWAPAWVSWRQGAGYVGWAPLPPSARIGRRGIVEVHDRAFAPQAFVFVSEQRLLEPVRLTTVIVNNTTVINQTVNITKVKVVNQTVINEGPRPEIIERRSGRKVEAIPVRELRHKEETEVVTRRPNVPSPPAKRVESPVRTASLPPKTIPARDPRQVEKPPEVTKQPQPPTTRNEVRQPAEQRPAPPSARPETARRARNERPQEIKGEKARQEIAPADDAPKGRQDAKPATPVLPREPRPIEKPSEVTKPPQLPARKNVVHGAGAGERKPSPKLAQPEAARPVGNERQRELERVKGKPETPQPAATRKPLQPPTSKQVEKPKAPPKEKPSANERVPAKKNRDEKKKDEEQEKSPQQPAAPPQPPK